MQIDLQDNVAAELLQIAEETDWIELRQHGERPSGQLERIADKFRAALQDAEMDEATRPPTEWWEIFPWEHEEGQAAFWASEEPPEEWNDSEMWEPLRDLPPPALKGEVLEDGSVMPF